jgi:hypothetical protein
MFADGVVNGFEEIERAATRNLGKALDDVESALYKPPVEKGAEKPEVAVIGDGDMPGMPDYEEFRRFDANMYDAHTDIVEEKEILQWQSAFPFIRVEGTHYSSAQHDLTDNDFGDGVVLVSHHGDASQMNLASPVPPSAGDAQSLERFSRTFFSTPNSRKNADGDVNFMVTGTKCALHMPSPAVDHEEEEEEEVDLVEGELEEDIALDRGAEPTPATSDTESRERETPYDADKVISPYLCRKEEVLSILCDAVWPECVDTLRPLVERVVKVSRETGVSYYRNDDLLRRENQHNSMDEDSGGGFVAIGDGRERKNSFDSDW